MILDRLKWPALVLVLVVLVVLPLDLTGIGLPWRGLRSYGMLNLSRWLVIAIAAMGVNLIVGYAGQETLAQAAFFGIGAYLTALTTLAGLPWGIAFLLSGLLTFAVGIVLGFPALRVQKHYLAFVTLAFTIFVWLVFRNEEWLTGGVSGIQGIRRPSLFGVSLRPPLYFYWFTLAVTVALTFVMWWLIRSPWGRAFTALRENAIRAESLGVDVRGYKLLAFAIGSAYGGMAGALYAPLIGFIDPSPFALGPSLLFMLMVVVGGAGTLVGPFLGAAVAVLLPEWLEVASSKLSNPFLQHLFSYLLVYAVIVILMMAFCPTGLVGLFKKLVTPTRRPHADDKGPTLGSPTLGGSTLGSDRSSTKAGAPS
jgi:branched-chain amino acid transport system permease protein